MTFKFDLAKLRSKEQLVAFLGIEEAVFEEVVNFDPGISRSADLSGEAFFSAVSMPFYRHEIPKKNRKRGYRTVWEPAFLKSEYKALSRRLGNYFSHELLSFPHHRIFGYVGGRNIRENAKDHCGHKNLISVDLENFFPSISALRITELLQTMGFEPAVASLLSRFVTIDGALPLGLPTSPTIANAICFPMDIQLEALAQNFGANFSRYADDISFSGDGDLPTLEMLGACVARHEFTIAEAKTRKSKLGQAHYVTGLSVSDPAQPHVPRQKKHRLRQELHYAEKFGLDDHFRHLGINDSHVAQQEINRLDGLVKFTSFHEPRLSARLKSKWSRILQASGDRPSFKPKNQHRTPFFIFVDEAEFVRPDGTRMLALAMAVSQHQEKIHQATRGTLEAAEAPRVFWRLFRLSHATISRVSTVA